MNERTDARVPRQAERLIEALGSSSEFRELILGDLAEEFASRRELDGPEAARRWYRRECFRVAPHLLRDWWGRLGIRGAAYFGAVACVSIAFSIGLDFILDSLRLLTPAALLLTLGITKRRWPMSLRIVGVVGIAVVVVPRMLGISIEALPPLDAIRMWTLAVIEVATAGYVAAFLGKRAPLPAALVTGAVLVAGMLGEFAVIQYTRPIWNTRPLWLTAMLLTITIPNTLIGGLLYVGSRSERDARASAESD